MAGEAELGIKLIPVMRRMLLTMLKYYTAACAYTHSLMVVYIQEPLTYGAPEKDQGRYEKRVQRKSDCPRCKGIETISLDIAIPTWLSYTKAGYCHSSLSQHPVKLTAHLLLPQLKANTIIVWHGYLSNP